MASVSLSFTGTAIAINGATNWGHWTYNVVSTDKLHISIGSITNIFKTLDGVQKQYNASTYWLIGDAQLFWESGLDPTQSHQIELINTAGSGMVMSLNDFTVYAPDNSSAR